MVKASAPAARTAATRCGGIDRTGDDHRALVAKPAPAGGDEIERVGLGRAIGENVDARAALLRESPAVRLDLRRRAAEPRRMADGLAGERQIAVALPARVRKASSTSTPPISQSTPRSRPSAIERNSSSREVETTSIHTDAPASRMAAVSRRSSRGSAPTSLKPMCFERQRTRDGDELERVLRPSRRCGST